jgi:hypothetical protein
MFNIHYRNGYNIFEGYSKPPSNTPSHHTHHTKEDIKNFSISWSVENVKKYLLKLIEITQKIVKLGKQNKNWSKEVHKEIFRTYQILKLYQEMYDSIDEIYKNVCARMPKIYGGYPKGYGKWPNLNMPIALEINKAIMTKFANSFFGFKDFLENVEAGNEPDEEITPETVTSRQQFASFLKHKFSQRDDYILPPGILPEETTPINWLKKANDKIDHYYFEVIELIEPYYSKLKG